jgi:hypothetical protein
VVCFVVYKEIVKPPLRLHYCVLMSVS